MKMNRPRQRFWLAYSTTAKVFCSYLWLWFLKKIFQEKRLATRIEQTHEKNAQRILKSLLDLKGLFIKVGQMISIMTAVLPKQLTKTLEELQDSVPAHPYQEIEKRFLEEFKKTPQELFVQFDESPIASASLGQVHRAWLADQTALAVKVQYPGIEAVVQADLKILKRLFHFFHFFFPKHGLKNVYQELSQAVLQELDFKHEGQNLEKIQQNFKEEPDFVFPKVFWELSTQRVLTLEWIDGIKISDLEKLSIEGLTPTTVAEKLIHAYCKQIFSDGLYHADPHPGNFLVQKDGKLAMVDFGAVASISDSMRLGAAQFIEGVVRRDHQKIRDALKEMGFISKGESEEIANRVIDFFFDRFKNLSLQDLQTLNFSQLGKLEDLIEFRKLNIRFSDLFDTFNVPKDWALLERALLLLFALTTHLDPKLNPMSTIVPYAEKFLLGRNKTVSDFLIESIQEIALSYLKLPAEIQRTLKKMNQGELEVSLKGSSFKQKELVFRLAQLNHILLTLGSGFLAYFSEQHQHWTAPYLFYLTGLFGLRLVWDFFKKL